MQLHSLRSKLLLAVSALVIVCCMLISLLVTHRYSRSIFKTATAQAENLAHALSLEATDKILINDLVILQKMLDYQITSNPNISYIFIIRDDQVIAHTFTDGVPLDLITANKVVQNGYGHIKKIASIKGEHYLDIAWPIFSGKAGVLHLGLSEKPYRIQVTKLWLQVGALTLGILLLALAVSFLFIKRLTKPLTILAEAAENIDKNNMEMKVKIKGQDEIGKLALSFLDMVNRMKDYMQRLEEKNIELNRAHRQTRASFEIAQEIGALPNLNNVCTYLIKKLQKIVTCKQMVILISGGNRDVIFVVSEKETKTLKKESFETAITALKEMQGISFIKKNTFAPPLIPQAFQSAKRLAVFPLSHENQLLGAMVIACSRNCNCVTNELNIIELILNQTSGAIWRSVLYEEEICELRTRIEHAAGFSGLIGKDPKMQVIYKLIEDISPTDATVLIQGESGTGKEMVAYAIHRQSLRKDKPFVVINCSAYPITLLESEIFGHEKGAFTGAVRQKPGRFEQAHGGTVFLDEIGEIPPMAQIKLLRVLQTQKFERVGGEQTLAVDVRILAATNKDLLQEVKNGQFREDLFYRLNVIPIFLPPLRERRNDIPLLERYFMRRLGAADQGKNIQGFSSEAMRLLLDYPWPGNVRELENCIEHAVLLARGDRIKVSDLPPALRNTYISPVESHRSRSIIENETRLLRDVLEECKWNKKQAALRLGVSRSTLYEKLKKYQITKPTIH